MRQLTSAEIVNLYAEHEAEISAVWESMPPERSMKDAVMEWLRRNPEHDPRGSGETVLDKILKPVLGVLFMLAWMAGTAWNKLTNWRHR